MSLELSPTYAESEATADAARIWTGRHATSAALFEIRSPYLPRDVQPILDEDHDCIVGYYRRFANRSHVFDLNANMVAVWQDRKKWPPPAKRDPVLVVGGDWGEGVHGATPISLTGAGLALTPTVLAHLRKVFGVLAQPTLLYREAALARMVDAHRYVPCHVLRLAIRYGEPSEPPYGLPRAARYLSRMLIRRQPYLLDLVTMNVNTTIVQFDYWRYADNLPATGAAVA